MYEEKPCFGFDVICKLDSLLQQITKTIYYSNAIAPSIDDR